jgi:hypothetical protein
MKKWFRRNVYLLLFVVYILGQAIALHTGDEKGVLLYFVGLIPFILLLVAAEIRDLTSAIRTQGIGTVLATVFEIMNNRPYPPKEKTHA